MTEALGASNNAKVIQQKIEEAKESKALDLSNSKLVQIPAEIPQQLADVITKLVLSFNDLRLARIEQLTVCTKLRVLHLRSTSLSQLPAQLNHLTSLTELDVSDNLISKLPPNLDAQLPPSLQVFDLSNNKLTSLPDSIGAMAELRVLNLSRNKLLKLPSSVGKLEKLETLDVEGNDLADPPRAVVANGARCVVDYFKEVVLAKQHATLDEFFNAHPQYKSVQLNSEASNIATSPTLRRPPISSPGTPGRPRIPSSSPAPASWAEANRAPNRLGRSVSVAYGPPSVPKKPLVSSPSNEITPSSARPLSRYGSVAELGDQSDPLNTTDPAEKRASISNQSLSKALSKLLINNAQLGRPKSEFHSRPPIPYLEDPSATKPDHPKDPSNDSPDASDTENSSPARNELRQLKKTKSVTNAKKFFLQIMAAESADTPRPGPVKGGAAKSRPVTSPKAQPTPANVEKEAAETTPSTSPSPQRTQEPSDVKHPSEEARLKEGEITKDNSASTVKDSSGTTGVEESKADPSSATESQDATVEAVAAASKAPLEEEKVAQAQEQTERAIDEAPNATVPKSASQDEVANAELESVPSTSSVPTEAHDDTQTAPSEEGAAKPTETPPEKPKKKKAKDNPPPEEFTETAQDQSGPRKGKRKPKPELVDETEDAEPTEPITKPGKKAKRPEKVKEAWSPTDKLTPIVELSKDSPYVLEMGDDVDTKEAFSPENLAIIDTDSLNDYMVDFYGHEHYTFMGEQKSGGAVIISVLKQPNENGEYKAFCRTKEGDERGVITSKKPLQRAEDFKQALLKSAPFKCLADVFNFRAVLDPSLPNDLKDLNEKLVKNKYKIGVIYRKPGQKEEDEMLGNDEGSQEFNDFLAVLGEKIKLEGWTKYDGQLDTLKNGTGTHSIFAEYEDSEIMFHVSTLLPSASNDTEKIQEKKVHIGNDIVVIIFIEGDEPLNPETIRSHFNHVFFVVRQYTDKNSTVYYQVNVVYKEGVDIPTPSIPATAVWKRNENFRRLLLSKLINTERSALKSKGLAMPLRSMRYQLMWHLYKKYDTAGKPLCCMLSRSKE